MLGVNVNLTVLVSTVKALAVIIWNTSTSNSEYLVFSVSVLTGILSPETDLDSKAALINNSDISSVLNSSTLFDVNLSDGSNGVDYTDSINGPHLPKLIDLVNRWKAEP